MLPKFFAVLLIAGTLLGTRSHAKERSKRIVRGEAITERLTGYDAILYYVWIGNAHRCSVLRQSTPHQYCTPSDTNVACGGTLVARKIVLTAGHCVGFTKNEPGDEYTRLVTKNPWEHLFECFVGNSDTERMRRGVFSKYFLTHQKYSKMKVFPNLASHDFGWIILRHEVHTEEDLELLKWTVAPLYTYQSLRKIWYSTLGSQFTCLIMGFGSHVYNFTTRKFLRLGSLVLRHGWTTTFNYEKCRWLRFDRFNLDVKYDYRTRATWSCHGAFGKNNAFFGDRDGGGPVTCNNQLFGVAAGYGIAKVRPKGFAYRSISQGVVFTAYQSSADYRKDFINAVNSYKPDTEPEYSPDGLRAIPMEDNSFVLATSKGSSNNDWLLTCIIPLFLVF